MRERSSEWVVTAAKEKIATRKKEIEMMQNGLRAEYQMAKQRLYIFAFTSRFRAIAMSTNAQSLKIHEQLKKTKFTPVKSKPDQALETVVPPAEDNKAFVSKEDRKVAPEDRLPALSSTYDSYNKLVRDNARSSSVQRVLNVDLKPNVGQKKEANPTPAITAALPAAKDTSKTKGNGTASPTGKVAYREELAKVLVPTVMMTVANQREDQDADKGQDDDEGTAKSKGDRSQSPPAPSVKQRKESGCGTRLNSVSSSRSSQSMCVWASPDVTLNFVVT